MTATLEAVWRRVDPIDRGEGMTAYLRYRWTLSRLAAHYGAELPGTVAAFAALSPNNDYMGNLRSTATLLKARAEGIPFERCTVSTYRACARRAWDYLDGIPFLERTKGPKTRAFYQNILDPWDPEPVTIDGHMFGLWAGQRLTMKQVVRLRIPYDRVADDFRSFAGRNGILPCQLQATLWFTWKRIHRVIYSPQLDVFNHGNCWLLDMKPEEIRPFPFK